MVITLNIFFYSGLSFPKCFIPLKFQSKKKTLYINPSHTKKINELDDEASDILLSKLINLSVTKKYQYSHQWQKKDLIIWDQRDLLHRASPEKVTNEKRIMIRSMILNKPHRII